MEGSTAQLPRSLLTVTAQGIRSQSGILEEEFAQDHPRVLLNKEKKDLVDSSNNIMDPVGNFILDSVEESTGS